MDRSYNTVVGSSFELKPFVLSDSTADSTLSNLDFIELPDNGCRILDFYGKPVYPANLDFVSNFLNKFGVVEKKVNSLLDTTENDDFIQYVRTKITPVVYSDLPGVNSNPTLIAGNIDLIHSNTVILDELNLGGTLLLRTELNTESMYILFSLSKCFNQVYFVSLLSDFPGSNIYLVCQNLQNKDYNLENSVTAEFNDYVVENITTLNTARLELQEMITKNNFFKSHTSRLLCLWNLENSVKLNTYSLNLTRFPDLKGKTALVHTLNIIKKYLPEIPDDFQELKIWKEKLISVFNGGTLEFPKIDYKNMLNIKYNSKLICAFSYIINKVSDLTDGTYLRELILAYIFLNISDGILQNIPNKCKIKNPMFSDIVTDLIIKKHISFPFKKYFFRRSKEEMFFELQNEKVKPNKYGTGKIEYRDFYYDRHEPLSDYYQENQRILCEFNGQSPMLFWTNPKAVKTMLVDLYSTNFECGPEAMRDYIWNHTKECSVFKPLVAKTCYIWAKAKRVLDISAGWGDRLLAAMAVGLERYLAFDPNINLKPGHDQMIQDFGNKFSSKNSYEIRYEPFEQGNIDETFDLVFTSPPYYTLEIYKSENQSTTIHKDFNSWMNNFLLFSMEKAWSKLEMNGYMSIHIEDGEFKYVDSMKSFMKNLGAKFIGRIDAMGDKNKARPIWNWQKVEFLDDNLELGENSIEYYFPGSEQSLIEKNIFPKLHPELQKGYNSLPVNEKIEYINLIETYGFIPDIKLEPNFKIPDYRTFTEKFVITDTGIISTGKENLAPIKLLEFHKINKNQELQLFAVVSDPETMGTVGSGKTWTKEKMYENINMELEDQLEGKNEYFNYLILYKEIIVGMISLYKANYGENDEYYIRIFVSKKYQGLGIGSTSIILAINNFRRIIDDYVYSAINPSNLASLAMHKKLGFKQVGDIMISGKKYLKFVYEYPKIYLVNYD